MGNPTHAFELADQDGPPRRLPIIALFAADAISMVGNMLATIAIPWYVLETTGSAAKTGLAGFFAILPAILAGLLGGTLVDRVGYKRMSVIADVASAGAVAMIPLLHLTIGLEFWQLLGLVFLGALLDAPGSTARQALLPDLAGLAKMPLERATSMHQVVYRTARMVGAPLAGLLIALIGTANVLWVDAGTFVVSAAVVAILVVVPRTQGDAAERSTYLGELRAGLSFIRRDALVFAIVVVVMLTNFLDSAFNGVVLPVYVNDIYGDALNLGLIVAASGAGAVLGALLYATFGPRLPRHVVFVSMFVLVTLKFWAFALETSLPILLVATAISGLGAGPINPIIGAVTYERIPVRMRGRVLGAITAGAWVAMPLGVLLGGLLAESLGVQPVIVGIGACYLVVTLSTGVIPAMRQMDRDRRTQAQ